MRRMRVSIFMGTNIYPLPTSIFFLAPPHRWNGGDSGPGGFGVIFYYIGERAFGGSNSWIMAGGAAFGCDGVSGCMDGTGYGWKSHWVL